MEENEEIPEETKSTEDEGEESDTKDEEE